MNLKPAQHLMERINFRAIRRLPMIHQAEASECGLACLAMVAGYHGWRTDIIELRKLYPVSLNGSNLKGLMYTARKMGMLGRPVRAKLSALDKLQTPCILHWEMNHFVVLKKVQKNKIVIHDPDKGVRVYSFEQASPYFTGVALELDPSEFFTPKPALRRMKLTDLWSGIRGLKRSLIYTFILSAVIQLLALAMPFYMQIVVDEVIPKYDSDLLVVIAVGFLILMLINALATFMRSSLMLYLGHSLNTQMTRNLFHHLLYLPAQWFEKRHIGDILSRFSSTKPVGRLFSEGIVAAIIDGVMALSTAAIMLFYNPILALIVFLAVTLFSIVRFLLFRTLKSRNQSALAAEAKEESTFIESVTAIQTIKVFGREYEREATWTNRLVDKVNNNVSVARIHLFFQTFRAVLFGVENVLVIFLGARLIFSNSITVGMLFAFLAYKQQFTGNVTALVERVFEFKMLSLHLERLADITFERPEVDLDEEIDGLENIVKISQREPEKFSGKIEFRDVWFKYGEEDPWVLKGVSFILVPGELTAIAGSSGGGKTTLLKLILGLAEPNKGQILVDDIPLKTIDIRRYRQAFGTVMQRDALLSGSIADNISFFDQNVDIERVQSAAHQASIHDEIEQLPMKYDTLIGHMGSSLSGGQQQRLLLARALYAQPDFLVMDEGTANLDAENERVILDNIGSLGLTRITVAHREAVIKSADKLFILEKGKLVSSGNETDLPTQAING